MTETKTETKSTPKAPHFDPMAFWTQHYATMEADFVARSRAAIATWAQLATEALDYMTQLSAEMRTVAARAAKPAV